MKQEDKQLLLKDLCARLPYGVIAQVDGWDEEEEIDVIVPVRVYSINTDGYVYFGVNDYNVDYYMIEDCTPYLRPMSSMTEEEKKEYQYITERWMYDADYSIADSIDWLNAHHFDYRGLIEKRLAISTEEYNPYKS